MDDWQEISSVLFKLSKVWEHGGIIKHKINIKNYLLMNVGRHYLQMLHILVRMCVSSVKKSNKSRELFMFIYMWIVRIVFLRKKWIECLVIVHWDYFSFFPIMYLFWSQLKWKFTFNISCRECPTINLKISIKKFFLNKMCTRTFYKYISNFIFDTIILQIIKFKSFLRQLSPRKSFKWNLKFVFWWNVHWDSLKFVLDLFCNCHC